MTNLQKLIYALKNEVNCARGALKNDVALVKALKEEDFKDGLALDSALLAFEGMAKTLDGWEASGELPPLREIVQIHANATAVIAGWAKHVSWGVTASMTLAYPEADLTATVESMLEEARSDR
jgi:hypothetical protein